MGMRSARQSRRESRSFCLVPLAPESRAAKASAFACPRGTVALSPAPGILRVPYRRPWQTQARLRPRRSDSWEQASGHLPLSDALPQYCRRPLLARAAIARSSAPFSLLSTRAAESTARLGQFPRLAQMTAIRLGIGRERKSPILEIRLVFVPLLLFVPTPGSPSQKSKSVESVVKNRDHPIFAPAPRG